jgi:hypothetical protein
MKYNRRTFMAWTSVFLLTLFVVLGSVGVSRVSAADKPYAGTTVRIIVNAEYVKFAMGLVSDKLMEEQGIALDVEVIPGDAFVTGRIPIFPVDL